MAGELAPAVPTLADWLVTELATDVVSHGSPYRAYPMLSTDDAGWVHVALLSAGEIVCRGPRRLAIALWPDSESTKNLVRTGQGVLEAVGGGGVDHLRLSCRRCTDIEISGRPLATFACDVIGVARDAVGYAAVTRGVEFELTKPSTRSDMLATQLALRDQECLGRNQLVGRRA